MGSKVLKVIDAPAAKDGKYEIVLGDDGKITCTCPSWRYSKGEKVCKHLKEYEEDNDGEIKKRKEESKKETEARLKVEREAAKIREEKEKAEMSKPFIPKLSYTVTKKDKSIIYPSVDTDFYVQDDHATMLNIIADMSKEGPQNVLLTGPQGCGKTELGVWFAAKHGRPLVVMNCATIREPKDWFGYKDAKDGSVFWHQSDFVRALKLGNCVILLDEFNRLHSTLHNALYPLLDARRSTFVEDLGEMVEVGPNTVFFATCNIGFNHTGTFQMDSAIEDRYGIRIECSFLPEKEEINVITGKTGLPESDAKKLCQFARDIRAKADGSGATLQRAVSTRQLLQTAVIARRMKAQGIKVRKALEYTILPFYSADGGKESEQAQVLMAIQGIFGDK